MSSGEQSAGDKQQPAPPGRFIILGACVAASASGGCSPFGDLPPPAMYYGSGARFIGQANGQNVYATAEDRYGHPSTYSSLVSSGSDTPAPDTEDNTDRDPDFIEEDTGV